jgi:hypothetical protein
MSNPESRNELFDDDAVIEAVDRRAEADIAEQRLLDHQVVRQWLRSWGNDRPLWPVP